MKNISKIAIIFLGTFMLVMSNTYTTQAAGEWWQPTSSISGEAHVQDKGWISSTNKDKTYSSEVFGTTGEAKRLEAINLHGGVSFRYRLYVPQCGGWLPWIEAGYNFNPNDTNTYAGTVGKAYRAEAIQIDMGSNVTNCYIAYRAHVENRGWLPWVFTGDISASTSYRFPKVTLGGTADFYSTDAGLAGSGLRLEAVEISFVRCKYV